MFKSGVSKATSISITDHGVSLDAVDIALFVKQEQYLSEKHDLEDSLKKYVDSKFDELNTNSEKKHTNKRANIAIGVSIVMPILVLFIQHLFSNVNYH